MASLSPIGGSPADSASGGMAPQHYHVPTPRELRAQAVHRLQIGGLGLASMLLLVGLANIIMDRARETDRAATAAAVSSVPTMAAPVEGSGEDPSSDPLADIGVVPDLPTSENVPPSAAPPLAPSSANPARR